MNLTYIEEDKYKCSGCRKKGDDYADRCGITQQQLEAKGYDIFSSVCPKCKHDVSVHPQGGGGQGGTSDSQLLNELKEIKLEQKFLMARILKQTDGFKPESVAILSNASNMKKKSEKYYFGLDKPKCMLTGGDNFSTSHIWAQSTFGKGLSDFKLTSGDVNNARNTLLLRQDIHHAFENKQICFLYDPTKSTFTCRVLDPEFKCDVDIDGEKLKYSKKTDANNKPVLPFRRLLSNHAMRAYFDAISKGWITDKQIDYKPYARCSGEFLDDSSLDKTFFTPFDLASNISEKENSL